MFGASLFYVHISNCPAHYMAPTEALVWLNFANDIKIVEALIGWRSTDDCRNTFSLHQVNENLVKPKWSNSNAELAFYVVTPYPPSGKLLPILFAWLRI